MNGEDLENYLLDKWLKVALNDFEVNPESKRALAEIFKTGKVWLLLDGLDEMGTDNPLFWVRNQIKQGWMASARILLTCRLNVWDNGKNYLEDFDVYRNLDFSEEQVTEFIDKFFGNGSDRSASLQRELNQAGKERIRDLIKNPLRLTLLCYTWQRREGALPETKAGLYEWFVDTLYEWKPEYFSLTSVQRKELERALGELAKEALDRPSNRFRLTRQQVVKHLGETDQDLCKLALALGWLNRVGVAEENPDEEVYAFFHPSFQEYFAALAIDNSEFFLKDNPTDPDRGIYRVFDSHWKEIILLWIGRNDITLNTKTSFIDCLYHFLEDEEESYYRIKALCLCGSLIGEFPNYNNDKTDEIIFQISDLATVFYLQYSVANSPNDFILQSLIETHRELAIDIVSYLLINEHYEESESKSSLVFVLEKIGFGNLEAVNTLVQLIQDCFERVESYSQALDLRYGSNPRNTRSESERSSNFSSIDKWERGLEFGKFSDREYRICFDAAISLHKISPNHPICGDTFYRLLKTGWELGALASFGDSIAFQLKKVTNPESDLVQRTINLVLDRMNEILAKIEQTEDSSGNYDLSLDVLDGELIELGKGTSYLIDRVSELVSHETSLTRHIEQRILPEINISEVDKIEQIIHQLNSEDYWEIQKGIRQVSRLGIDDPVIIDRIIELINSSDDFDVRLEACKYLLIRDSRYNDDLYRLIISGLQSSVIEEQKSALTISFNLEINTSQIIEALQTIINTINQESDYEMIFEAIEYFCFLKPNDENTFRSLIKLWLGEASTDNRLRSIKLSPNLSINNLQFLVKTLANTPQYQGRLQILWQCSLHMTYPEFYQAWHDRTETPIPKSLQQQDLSSILENLKTDNPNLRTINIKTLNRETDLDRLAKGISNRAFLIPAFPITDIYDLERHIRTEIPDLALILYGEEPIDPLLQLCQQIGEFARIAILTDRPIEPPLRGLPTAQPNLENALRSWLEETAG